MANQPNPFVVFTSDRSNISDSMNAARRALVERQLTQLALPFKRVLGVYKGTSEHAYIVPTPTREAEIACLRLAQAYGQESVLLVESNLHATLLYLHARGQGAQYIKRTEPVGFWRVVSQAEAEASDSYTLDATHGVYFTTRELP